MFIRVKFYLNKSLWIRGDLIFSWSLIFSTFVSWNIENNFTRDKSNLIEYVSTNIIKIARAHLERLIPLAFSYCPEFDRILYSRIEIFFNTYDTMT